MVTYHFPPLHVTASQRASAWASYLPKHGIDLTVVTFNWPGSPTEFKSGAEIIRLPVDKLPDHTRLPLIWRVPFISKLATLATYLAGRPDYHIRSHERAMRDFLNQHLQQEQYDLMLGMFSPHFHLRHAAAIKRRFKLPFVIDFRDLFNNALVTVAGTPPPPLSIKDRIILHHWKRWMRQSSGYSAVSQPHLEQLNAWFNKKGTEVRNGFTPFSIVSQPDPDRFITLHSGSLSRHRDLGFFLRAYRSFAHNKNNCTLVFTGVHHFSRPYIKRMLRDHAPDVHVELRDRTTVIENQQAICSADLLIIPGLREKAGSYSGSHLEYLASERAVLLAGGQGDLMEAELQKHDGCFICSTQNSVNQVLEELYQLKERGENLRFKRSTDHLTREAQAALMASYLKSVHKTINEPNET